MSFTDADSVLAYLGAVGPFAPLNGNVLDPITTASGGLGGEVLGLELNVDFSDANALPGALGCRSATLLGSALGVFTWMRRARGRRWNPTKRIKGKTIIRVRS